MVTLPDGATIEMQWKQIKYANHDAYIVFQVIPMISSKDIVLIPNKNMWRKDESIFTNEEREEIIFLIERIAWKREIKLMELNVSPVVNEEIKISKGMIEGTEGYIKLTSENLFDPSSKLNKDQVKNLYCRLEEKYAEAISGSVTIPLEVIIEGSVMKEITIPILEKNKNAKLNYIAT